MLRSLVALSRPLLRSPVPSIARSPVLRLLSSSAPSSSLLTRPLFAPSPPPTLHIRAFSMPKAVRRKASPLARPVKTARKASKRKVSSDESGELFGGP